MPFYKGMKDYEPSRADWIARRLLALRSDLDRAITAGRQPNSLVVGSWNLKQFDFGVPRLDDSYHFIAEIVGAFDICAIQEVKRDIKPLKRLVDLLGPNWSYFVNDLADHQDSTANAERMAFVYNRNKVVFRSLVGEIVPPEAVSRTPFFAAFQAGWFKFCLVSSHIRYGKTNLDGRQVRAEEIAAICRAIRTRSIAEDQVYIFLGDMNIERPGGVIMEALTSSGLEVPPFGPTNMSGTKYFDQIAYTVEGDDEVRNTKRLRYGVFDWRDAVYPQRERPIAAPVGAGIERVTYTDTVAYYEPVVATHRIDNNRDPHDDFEQRYKGWTTDEMSDHLPIWVELETDYSDEYLNRFKIDETLGY